MSNNPGKQRNEFIDILKGFTIYLVVLGHALQHGNGSEFLEKRDFFDDSLYQFIYSFHMPLFMLISGYFFNYSLGKRSYKTIILSRLRVLILPIISWNAIYYFAHYIYNFQNISFLYELKHYISSVFMSFWFLWAVFWNSLVLIIVRKYLKDNPIVYILIFIVLLFIPDSYNLSLYKFMYPYYVIGYYFNKINGLDLLKKLKVNQISQTFLVGVVFVALFLFYKRETFIYVSGHTLIGSGSMDKLIIIAYRFIIGIIGSTFIILILNTIYKHFAVARKILKLFVVFGIESLGIYIVSNYLNIILTRITPDLTLNYWITIGESLAIIIVSLGIIKIIKLNRFSNLLLLGGR